MSISGDLATTASRLDTLNFTAVDFQTANGQPGSVCAAGIVQVRSGCITRVEQTFVRPPRGLDYFSPRHIAGHGITFQAVQQAPAWPEVWAILEDVAEGDIVVAHNAAIDVSVITRANTACGIDAPPPSELCTAELARLLLPRLPNYELRTVASYFDLPAYDHEPGFAAVATAGIAVMLAHRTGARTAGDLVALISDARATAGRRAALDGQSRTYMS